MVDEKEGVATATFSTDDLSGIVAEFVARQSGIALPVQRHVQWAWSPGVGPVAIVKVESVPNVSRLAPVKKAKGKRG